MKRYVLAILLTFLSLSRVSAQQDELLVMFWNLENFFDWKDGGQGASDSEFSSKGARRWTSKRFFTKVSAVSKTLLWVADREGRLPDVAAFAELENGYVLRQLISSDQLRRYGYSMVHYDSPDPRGIDVGLIYRKETLRLLASRPVRIREFRTRDILAVDFLTRSDDTLHVLVNHHPSKYGGASTEDRRKVAMRYLVQACDSIAEAGAYRNVVAVGDFNDTPDSEAFLLMGNRLVNLAEPLAASGAGSIRFDGKWELIDMAMVSPDHSGASMKILDPPFLLTRDAAHSGYKPLRTYSGPRYLGGVSDHLPVCVHLQVK